MAFNGGAAMQAPRAPQPFNGGARAPRTSKPVLVIPKPPRASTGIPKGKPAGTNLSPGTRPPAALAGTTIAPPPNPAAPAQPAQQPSPLDATYWAQVNQANFQAGQKENAINQQSAYDRIALAEAQRQLEQREPVLEQNATNTANGQGLLYSGALGNQIGNMKTALLTTEANQNQGFAQREAGRQSQIQGVQANLPYSELAARLASIERANRAAASAALTAPPMPAAATDALGVPRAQGHSTAYTGPGLYAGAGPNNPNVHVVGHSARYRGPGRYVANTGR